MRWTTIAHQIWQPEGWLIVLLAACYAVPLMRLVTLPFRSGARWLVPMCRAAGAWEIFVSPVRDTAGTAFLLGGALWQGWRGILLASGDAFAAAGAAIVLPIAALALRRQVRADRFDLLAFLQRWPTVHPQEWFDHLLCLSGIVRHAFPERPARTIDPARLDFRSGKPSSQELGFEAFIVGAASTALLARLVLLSRKRGAGFLRASASALATVWGARLAEIAQAAVTVEGRAHLPEAGGAEIFLFTHGSLLDFALVPLVLASRPLAGDAGSAAPADGLPSFLLAKDHFRDNFFLYRILGLGRVAEELGMIFVERGLKRDAQRARRVTSAAAAKVVQGGAPLAIFPQGTRAAAFRNSRGKLLDAAYYTVGPRERLRADGKHLKKGAAHIAVAAANAMPGSAREVRVVPVAIAGAAVACPRRRLRIFPGVHIRLRVGPPIVVGGSAPAGEAGSAPPGGGLSSDPVVERLHVRIDHDLRTAARVHAELERRFFEDMRGMLDAMKIDEISLAMKPWREGDTLLHAILDAIYTCPPARSRSFLGELIHHLLNFAPREELLALKARVADAVPL